MRSYNLLIVIMRETFSDVDYALIGVWNIAISVYICLSVCLRVCVVCQLVCLPVRSHISITTHLNFINFSMLVTRGCRSTLLCTIRYIILLRNGLLLVMHRLHKLTEFYISLTSPQNPTCFHFVAIQGPVFDTINQPTYQPTNQSISESNKKCGVVA